MATMPYLTYLVIKNCFNVVSRLTIKRGTRLKSLQICNTNINESTNFENFIFAYKFPETCFQGLKTIIIIKVKIYELTEEKSIDLVNAIKKIARNSYISIQILWFL